MPSSLTWIDHDPAAREGAIRILSLFQERESRDELGLGAIRDAFADALFPGTSTIQTRLRYMLFVPWIYTNLEQKRAMPPAFAARARQMELNLVEPLLAGSDHAGVFGRVAGKGLKRLPSSVYWNGLGEWSIRRIHCSQDEYHRHIGEVYRRRDIARQRTEKDDSPDAAAQTWHPRLPDPPEGFPDKVKNLGFDLTPEEASFLLDCILKSQRESLLAYLALNCKPVDCEFPWQHPDTGRFSATHRELLNHAEMFSTLMHGAGFLYNLMLAELAEGKVWKRNTVQISGTGRAACLPVISSTFHWKDFGNSPPGGGIRSPRAQKNSSQHGIAGYWRSAEMWPTTQNAALW